MSLPSINQVRHFYVIPTAANDLGAGNVPAAVGDTVLCTSADGATIWVHQLGKGGLVSSDKIKLSNITSVTKTLPAAMKTKLGNHTVKVTEVSAGQVYEIKLQFLNYVGNGAQDQGYVLGTYRAKSSDSASDIAAGLAASLQDALGLDAAANAASLAHYKRELCTVTVSGDTITVHEADLSGNWKRVKFPLAYIPVRIFLGGIFTNDDYLSHDWATITLYASLTTVNDAAKKVAELETFCMGARGDEYRGMGYPRNIDTEYMVNPDLASGYILLNIHYFYQGANEAVQKSEKDVTVAYVEAGDFESDLSGALNTVGKTIETNTTI